MHIAKQAEHYRMKCAAYAVELKWLLSYVTSPKFNEDNMVNANDVVLRIREIQQHIENAYGSLED